MKDFEREKALKAASGDDSVNAARAVATLLIVVLVLVALYFGGVIGTKRAADADAGNSNQATPRTLRDSR